MTLDRKIKKLPTEELIEIGNNIALGDLSADFGAHLVWITAVMELKNRGVRLPHIQYE